MTGTVVLTGAGSGIGRATAVELAARGWRVVVTDIDDAAAAQTLSMLDPDIGPSRPCWTSPGQRMLSASPMT